MNMAGANKSQAEMICPFSVIISVLICALVQFGCNSERDVSADTEKPGKTPDEVSKPTTNPFSQTLLTNGLITADRDYYCEVTAEGGIGCVHAHGAKAVPELPSDLGKVRYISFSSGHYCAISEDDVVRCWGQHAEETKQYADPTSVHTSGGGHCVVDAEGVHCINQSTYRNDASIPPLSNPVMAWSFFDHECAMADEGLKCWGNNFYHQIDIPDIKSAKSVVGHAIVTCVLSESHSLCHGDGGVGVGRFNTLFEQYDNILSIDLLPELLCVVLPDAIDCIGKFGGDGNYWKAEEPPEGLDFSKGIVTGLHYTLGIDGDGKLLCWGEDPDLPTGEQTMCEKIMNFTRFR